MTHSRDEQVPPTGSALFRAVAFALSGEMLCANVDTPAEIVNALADAGWDARRLRALHARAREMGEAWPRPVPIDLLDDAGPARVAASVNAVRGLLGGNRPVAVRRGGVLDATDRRLLDDVPPHHGAVG